MDVYIAAILTAVVIAVVGASRNYPTTIYNYGAPYCYPSNDNYAAARSYTAKPLQFHHKEILKIAEELYDRLLKAIRSVIYRHSFC